MHFPVNSTPEPSIPSALTRTAVIISVFSTRTDETSVRHAKLASRRFHMTEERYVHKFNNYCYKILYFVDRAISLQILGNNKLDALFYVFIYFMPLHVSSVTTLIIRSSNCINTSSGMISLCDCLVCRYLEGPAYQAVTYTD
jgi:hypothetical protein